MLHQLNYRLKNWRCYTLRTQPAGATVSSAENQPNPGAAHLPYGLVSLWDMINFHLVHLMHALWMLDFYEKATIYPAAPKTPPSAGVMSLAALTDAYELPGSRKIPDLNIGHGKEIVEAVSAVANELDLKTAKHRLMHFELALRYSMTEADYKSEIKVLRDAIKHDLSERRFYHYPPAKLDVLMKFYPQWKQISEAFPPVREEALSATDCYALDHNTASVFHCMRVAEYGLRALAKERRVRLPRDKPIDWGQWQEIIREIAKEAARIGDKAKPGTPKDNALSFYSGAVSDLNAFKDEYRNQVMHVRKTYDEHQALRALVKVHAFMERISERITHKHYRVRWGLKFNS